jgi:hypothetical protein
LKPTFEHPSEPHSLKALLQELSYQLMDTGNPKAYDAIIAAAHEHLLRRFT